MTTDKDRELFKEINWLYDRLSKKEMNILMKWVWANCETVKQDQKKKDIDRNEKK